MVLVDSIVQLVRPHVNSDEAAALVRWFPAEGRDPDEVSYVMWLEADGWRTGTMLCRHELAQYSREYVWVAPHAGNVAEKCLRWSDVRYVM